MNSKIPIRSTSSKPRAVSGNKNERSLANAQKKDECLRNPQIATTKTDWIPKEGKENKLLLGKVDKKNLQSKLTQGKKKLESQYNFKDRSKNFVKKNEKDVKEPSCQVLSEHSEYNNIKTESPKNVMDKAFDFSLKNRGRKPRNPICMPRTHQDPVSNGKSHKKTENSKSTANHPSQPDIEFVPDENCRNRILTGRELSPGILQWPRRTQSSINGRFSIFNKPISPPVDPRKGLDKFLEKLNVEDRRSSVRPLSPLCHPLDKFGSLHPKTPNRGFELAMKRLSDLRLKDKPKSAKKVTFQLPDSDWTSKVSWKERKQEINELRLSDMSERSSLHSTPELNVKLLPSSSLESDIDRRNTISSFGDVKSKIFQNNAISLGKVGNGDRKLSSILKGSNATGADCNERRESRAVSFNFGPRKMRRSLSASELNNCPSSKSATVNDSSSSKINAGESNQVGGSDSSCTTSNACNSNILRTSISSPELRVRFVNAEDGKLGHCEPNKQVYSAATVDSAERRMSRILSFNFWSKKPRRSMSASDLSSSSVQVQLKGKSSEFSNKIDAMETNQGGSKSPPQSSNICNFNMLRTSISSPELSDRFFKAENSKLRNNTQNATNADKMPSGILRSDSVAAIDYDERRKSEILTSHFKSKKLRRSMSVSELDFPSTALAQTLLKDASSQFLNQVDAGSMNKQIESSPSPFLSPGTCNLGTLRTSISSPELREMFPLAATERKPESNKTPNPLLYSQSKAVHFRPNNLLLNSVKLTEPRSSLYLSCIKNATQPPCSPKLCTPCPVSLNPKSRVANSFSPEFLCRRTSNIVSHAPIRTPLVLRHLAENELDDDHLSPVRQKLNFETVQKDKEDSKELRQAYLQSFKTQQVIMDLLTDQECCIISSLADSPLIICIRALSNPVAKILDYGDESHFVPLVLP